MDDFFSIFQILTMQSGTFTMAKQESFEGQVLRKASQKSGNVVIHWSVKSPKCCLFACIIQSQCCKMGPKEAGIHAREQ